MKQRPGGVGQLFHDGRLVKETHTSTCSHCQALTEFPSRKAMLDYVDVCRGCMRLICLNCLGKPCIPFEKRADVMEARARRQASESFLRDFSRVSK